METTTSEEIQTTQDIQPQQNTEKKVMSIEDFKKQVVSMSFAGAFFTTLGAYAQYLKPMENYNHLAHMVNNNLPEVIRNQGSDIAGVSLLALATSVAATAIFSKAAETEGFANRQVQRTTALFGASIGMFFALEEASRISGPLMSMKDGWTRAIVGNSGTPRGDWGDVLAYSTPIIAAVTYFAYDLGKTGIEEIKDRQRQKEIMHDVDVLQ